jgi:acyl-CoA hydrolase
LQQKNIAKWDLAFWMMKGIARQSILQPRTTTGLTVVAVDGERNKKRERQRKRKRKREREKEKKREREKEREREREREKERALAAKQNNEGK